MIERIRGVKLDNSVYQKTRQKILGFFVDNEVLFQWGGEPSIIAMCHLLNANIVVYNEPHPPKHFNPVQSETTYRLAYANNHYDSVQVSDKDQESSTTTDGTRPQENSARAPQAPRAPKEDYEALIKIL